MFTIIKISFFARLSKTHINYEENKKHDVKKFILTFKKTSDIIIKALVGKSTTVGGNSFAAWWQ